jgi:hypothetical protein
MMATTKTIRWSALAALLLASGACVDLAVENLNAPDRDRALARAGDVEALISGTFRTWWNLQQGNAPGPAMSSMADEITGSQANYGFQDQGMEPAREIINQNAYQWGYWVYDPWLLTNRALASIRDGLQSIDQLGLQLGTAGQDNPRIEAFAKFMQGLFLGNIALQYDQGFILDQTVADPLTMELKPYGEVMTTALAKLDTARQIASQNAFTIPGGWMGSASYSSAAFIRLTHSYQARLMAEVARTPTDRAAVDWPTVLTHVQNGVTADFGVALDGAAGIWRIVLKGFMGPNSDVDLAYLGPADQSGAYSTYEATDPASKTPFVIDTDDRRIRGADSLKAPGLYVHYRNSIIQPADRGLWYGSNYAPWWYYTQATTNFGFAPDLSVAEMGFLAAEAYIRGGQPALALPYINQRRVANGQLPAAAVDGVSGTRCVPRSAGLLKKASTRAEGACGDLMQTLIYEKDMETAYLYAGRAWYDHRGLGTLRTGRALQAPLPAVDLELLGLQVYTFGGVGGTSSAP